MVNNTAKTDGNARAFNPKQHTLEMLFKSTENFHKRFSNYPPTGSGALVPFMEEVSEVVDSFNNGSDLDFTEEVVDVIVTLMGLMMSKGVSYTYLVDCMECVIDKNDAKTLETHVKAYGKIKRK